MSSKLLPDTYSVAIEGFSAFERNALASFFRLAAQRTPAYQQVEETGLGDFVIADADHAGAVAAVRRGQRERDTVFIGARAPQGATAWLPRPIDPLHIVRALDGLIELRLALPAASSALMPLGPIELPDETAGSAIDVLLPEVGGQRPVPAAVPRGGGGREVLVVDDSAIARQFLKVRLQRMGYRVQLASSGEQALDLIERQAFALAFLDVVLGAPGSVDGLQLCQTIKQRAARGLAPPCGVLLVTSLRGSSDRVRGSLAGCDAYLTKPLLEAPFIAALQQVDRAFEWDAASV